jgi:hypothetical protein
MNFIWYMLSIQCEELRINHLTPLLVVTMSYDCWFLWWIDYIEHFKWRLHFQSGVAFWRVVLREAYFEGPSRVWRALVTSILNIDTHQFQKSLISLLCVEAYITSTWRGLLLEVTWICLHDKVFNHKVRYIPKLNIKLLTWQRTPLTFKLSPTSKDWQCGV